MFGAIPIYDEGLVDPTKTYWFGGGGPAGYAWAVSGVPTFGGTTIGSGPAQFIPDQPETVAITPASTALTDSDFIKQLYATYYRRQADPPGLQFWVNQLASGLHTRASAEQAFRTSPDQSPDSTKTLAQYLAQFGITLPVQTTTGPATTTTTQPTTTTTTQPTTTTAVQPVGSSIPIVWIALGLGALLLLSGKK